MNIKSFSGIKEFFLDNKTVKQTLFKNTAWMVIATGLDRLLRLALFIYVARILGATEYGKFSFALAFISLFVIFYDFGLPSIVTREFSREKDKKEEFYSVISLKILLSLTALILIWLTSFFVADTPEVRRIIFILAVFSMIDGFISILYAFFQAFQKMEYRALIEIIQAILITGIGFFVLFNFPSVENLSNGYLIAASLTLFFALVFFHFKFLPLKIAWQKSVWQKFLTMSWPLGLGALFGVINNYADSVMMGSWNMFAETGWYNAAFKITTVLMIPGALISRSFYPVLSGFFKESKEKFQKAWNYQMDIMIFLAVPSFIGGIIFAPKIIYSFYPDNFIPSVLTLQILIVAAAVIFIHRPLYDAMVASNQQKKIFWITALTSIVNIVLNLILIPRYSLYGAAAATVAANILTVLIFLKYTMKFTPISPFQLNFLYTFFLAAISSFLMYMAIKQPLIYNFNIFLFLIMGSVTYFLAFFGLRYIFKSLSLYGSNK
ncbi:MAG: oligosaccharide flippase family protein [Patescibacteria group bacterium]